MLDALDFRVLSEWTVQESPIYFSCENKSSDVFIFSYYGIYTYNVLCFMFYYNDESGGDNGKKKKKNAFSFCDVHALIFDNSK